MSALTTPSSASRHHLRSYSHKNGSGYSTSTESDVGSAHSFAKSKSPSPKEPSGQRRQRHKRQTLPAIEASSIPKPSPLRRSSSPSSGLETMKPVAKKMTKNYDHLVKDYERLKPYARQPDGTYPDSTLCVFCEAVPPRLVFFPCQHCCVCDACMAKHEITNEPKTPSSWAACPVCLSGISVILHHTGKEEEYWEWALEIKPTLPIFFKADFRESAKRLRKASSVQPGASSPDEFPTAQSISAPEGEDVPTPLERSHPSRSRRSVVYSMSGNSQHSIRRFSLVRRRLSTASAAPASSNESSCASPSSSHCSIL